MFDINGGEMVVLAGIALVILGPDKLPGYAAQAARLVRQLREMADGAKDQMREQMGSEFDDVDWKALDPRQYDPRRIVRDALFDSEDADGDSEPNRPEKPVSKGAPRPVDLDDPAGGATSGASDDGGGSSGYDDEAT